MTTQAHIVDLINKRRQKRMATLERRGQFLWRKLYEAQHEWESLCEALPVEVRPDYTWHDAMA